ncbi:MAG: 3-deoxy-8-phosphooctulonate synthase [Fimbriimonadaceae bacterium]|nr:MAG: 3-deoxy-8-phosphooctulonate synthase [Fimbriimonadaceae bacterium]
MKPVDHPFLIRDIEFGTGNLVLIAGPCLAESQALCEQVAGTMKELCLTLGIPYIFKASFDKANRTSLKGTRGFGMAEGLKIIQNIGQTFDLPTTTDVHDAHQVGTVASVVDLLQVPAFLCRQTDLLEACAVTGKPVNVKKGQFLAPWDTKNIVDKLSAFGAKGAMLTDRGTSFGYNTLVVDMPGLEIMRSFGHPVCFDATHSAQRPGGAGTATGGNRDSIPAMARAAAAVGIDALFLEVHPDPANALSDAATQIALSDAGQLLTTIVEIHRLRQSFA